MAFVAGHVLILKYVFFNFFSEGVHKRHDRASEAGEVGLDVRDGLGRMGGFACQETMVEGHSKKKLQENTNFFVDTTKGFV
jgi:hypothetical protein